jgi:hypothetical protein
MRRLKMPGTIVRGGAGLIPLSANLAINKVRLFLTKTEPEKYSLLIARIRTV